MSRRHVWLLLAALLCGAFVVPSSASTSCPAAKTCPAYALMEMRWPSKAGRPIVIPYYVSTRFDSPTFRASDLPRVVAAAARTWERANPRLRFRYLGTTDALPSASPDGRNVIGFGVPLGAPGLAAADAPLYFTDRGRLYEADIVLDAKHVWVWHECPQRDGGCSGHSRSLTPAHEVWGPELQGVLLHELGHWLALDHSDGAGGSEMTMVSMTPEQNLAQQTLGLGDILGVRAAYPCGRCGGKPVVYAP